MKLTKAIELLSLKPLTGDKALDLDMQNAMNLGKEALKRLNELRQYPIFNPNYELPGEEPE